jgi:uncharacterized protein YndB with AHSA1/START domain
MSEQTVVHNTFVIERTYPHPVEKVFAAFADASKKRRWFAEGHNHEVEEFTMDFRVGGNERSAYRMGESTPFPGVPLVSEGIYLDIVPNQRIVQAAQMAMGGKRISATMVTIELLPTAEGTDLICTHQGAFFEGSGGPQMREQGWQKLFSQLDAELAK